MDTDRPSAPRAAVRAAARTVVVAVALIAGACGLLVSAGAAGVVADDAELELRADGHNRAAAVQRSRSTRRLRSWRRGADRPSAPPRRVASKAQPTVDEAQRVVAGHRSPPSRRGPPTAE